MGAVLALMRKEFLAIWNDKKSRTVIIVPPLLQLLIFSFAVNLEVKNLSLAVLDRDQTPQSRELVRGFANSKTFREVVAVASEEEMARALETTRVNGGVVVPHGFSGAAEPTVQLLLDGRRSNTAQGLEGYATRIVAASSGSVAGGIETRIWYNPNLENFWWIVPSLTGILTMLVALLLTALSVARERELGTFDQLLVSPLTPFQILVGKSLPPMLISLAEGTVILLAAVFLFGVPIAGSPLLLYLALFAYLFSIIGMGLFLSSLAMTQQQAILGAFLFMIPTILLSGFGTPVENMPGWLQPVSQGIPLYYLLILIKGVFLKGMGLQAAWGFLWPLFTLGAVSLAGAGWLFRNRLE